MSGSTTSERCAAFVRGFFAHLEKEGVEAAVLHGWQDDFEGGLSDVDYVIEAEGFEKNAQLIESYCREVGWMLCQVLRHETTAAFCVCAAKDDPTCVVALDACSDYQRSGRVFLGVEELLAGRQPLDWGGNRLASEMELKYRFIKAVAKGKDVEEMRVEFEAYSSEEREACVGWIRENWGVAMTDWSTDSLGKVFSELHKKHEAEGGFFSLGSLGRILRRVLFPTGLVVVVGEGEEERAEKLREVFGHLYFRRTKNRSRAGMESLGAMVKSTFITAGTMGLLARVFVGRGNVVDAREGDLSAVLGRIADFLHGRCGRREGLS